MAGISGKAGGLIFYESNGLSLVRTRPNWNKKRKPTMMQQLHLDSFKVQHVFARKIKYCIIDRVWSQETIPPGLNPYNYFIKCNRESFGKTTHVEFPQFMNLSLGKLLQVDKLNVSIDKNILNLSWKHNTFGNYASSNDKLTIALLFDRNNLEIIETSFIRSDEKAELPLNDSFKNVKEGFIFWASTDEKQFSRSVYWTING
jgi:hypothetical protein